MLALKEVPFLLLMSISILQQIDVERITKVSASLGYSRAQIWWKCIFPNNGLPSFASYVGGACLQRVGCRYCLWSLAQPTRHLYMVLVHGKWFNDPDLNLLPRAGRWRHRFIRFGFVDHRLSAFNRMGNSEVILELGNIQAEQALTFQEKRSSQCLAVLSPLIIPLMGIWVLPNVGASLIYFKSLHAFLEFEWDGIMSTALVKAYGLVCWLVLQSLCCLHWLLMNTESNTSGKFRALLSRFPCWYLNSQYVRHASDRTLLYRQQRQSS